MGAPVQSALPIIMKIMAALRDAFRPKTSAIWAQNGMKAADVRLKADTIQFSCDVSPKSPAIQGKALAMLQREDVWSAQDNR